MSKARSWKGGLLASCAALALVCGTPAAADVITSGQVFPAGVTSGTTDNFITVGNDGAGSLTINNGSALTATPTNPPTASSGMNVGTLAGSNGSVLVTGPNSLFTFNPNQMGTPATADDVSPVLNIGRSGTGAVTVSAGGRLVVNGVDPGIVGQDAGIQLGGSGTGANGTGTLTVTGPGSTVDITGFQRFINIGRNGASANGTLDIQDGGVVNARSVNMGRVGATGTLNMSGGGSTLNLVGQSGGFNAGMTLGSDINSVGIATISAGARINIDASGGPGGGISIGGNGTGLMTLQGNGTELVIVGDQNNVAQGIFPGFTVGRNAQGTLNVLNGAKATVIDNSAEGFGGWAVGGNAAQVAQGLPAGNGQVLISGVGSEIRTIGNNSSLSVGRSGTGSLTIASGGAVSSNDLTVGRDAGATGTLTVNNGTITLSAQTPFATAVGDTGAVFQVGRSGTGTATLVNSSVAIQSAAGTGLTGLSIGGTRLAPVAGTGTATLNNSSVSIAGDTPALQVGIETGTGTLTMTNASSITLGNGGQVVIGSGAGSTGTVTVGGNSSLNVGAGGFVGVARSIDGAQASGGTGTLILSNGSVNAPETHVYAGGLIGGIGTIAGDLIVHEGGIAAPGSSPGTLTVNGDFILEEDAKLVIEVQELGGVLSTDFLEVSGLVDLDGTIEFRLLLEATLDDLLGFVPQDFFNVLVDFTNVDFTGSTDDGDQLAIQITPNGIVATQVPEPATLALIAFGMAGLGVARHRRRSSR